MKELIVNVKDNVENIFLLEDGELIEKYEDSNYKKRLEGNIYIGKVQNVIPGLQAAFVNVGENKNAFIHLKDILPKNDSKDGNPLNNIDEFDIKKYVKVGMPLLVEIKRDATCKKGSRASTHINIAGRYLVYMPNSTFITLSQKIEDERERKRLYEIVEEFIPEGSGAIIRTSAIGKSKEELQKDFNKLSEKWNKIVNTKFSEEDLPLLVHKTNDLLYKLLLDLVDFDLKKIYVNSKNLYDTIKEILKDLDVDNIEIVYKEKEDFSKLYNLQKQKEDAENRKIWLNCGGFITIDKTEALTAIDVNSGKYIGKEKLEDTVFTVNREASIEIAKQLRLRDIGGIIIIDYIDMHDDKNKENTIKILEECIKKDRSRVQIEGFTKLNLLEITRKHICSN